MVVIAHRNPVYSTMSLVVTLLSVAALFVLLGAPFLAVLQVLIYTGAIVVLFLFVIMLLNVQRESAAPRGGRGQQLGARCSAPSVFAGMLGMLLWRAYSDARDAAARRRAGLAARPGAPSCSATYLLPFEIDRAAAAGGGDRRHGAGARGRAREPGESPGGADP